MKNKGGIDWAAVKTLLQENQTRMEEQDPFGAPGRQRLLLQRARTLAMPQPETRTGASYDDILIFRAGSDRYGILLPDAVEILTNAKRTIIPGAPEQVAGVIQVRGEIRPVFHLRRLLQHTEEPNGDRPGVVLLVRAGSRQFGILIDEVEDIRSAGAESRKPAPANSGHIRWMTEDLIAVLDVATLIEEDH